MFVSDRGAVTALREQTPPRSIKWAEPPIEQNSKAKSLGSAADGYRENSEIRFGAYKIRSVKNG